MKRWKKLGLAGTPDHSQPEQFSHCQLPVADIIGKDVVRVYYAGRTKDQVSHISYIDLQINGEDFKEIGRSQKPVLGPGPIGYFDQFGVYPSCIINHKGAKYLFYIGWIRGYEQPLFYAQIGLAVYSEKDKTFSRCKNIPVMGIGEHDPCLVTSPNVILDGEDFRMTYVSGFKWERGNDGKLKSFYNIKIAYSKDLYNWHRNGETAIDFKENESNIARSCVIRENEKYKMWFSYVSADLGKYRIGYAEAENFLNWKRMDDHAGISIGESNDFDSEMICYPNIFELNKKKYLLYNGNQFGKDGFGLAIEEND